MAELVELRVHGVSGTPPEATLDSPDVVQVAGDDLSRVFRRADGTGEPQPESDPHLVEAFHWGRHTAGGWRQGLWFLLAPFGMINLAQFMLPRPVNRPALVAHALAGAFLRLLGLVMTLLFTASAALALVDLVAWQWAIQGGAPEPGRAPAEPSPAERVALLGSGWVLGIALVLVVAVLLGVALLGRRRAVAGVAPRTTTTTATDPGLSQLARPGFYGGDPDVPALAGLHLGGALALVAFVGFGAASPEASGWTAGRAVAAAVMGAVAVVVAVLGDPENSARVAAGTASAARTALTRWLGQGAVLVGAVLVVLALVAIGRSAGPPTAYALPPDAAQRLALPVSDDLARTLLIGGAAVLACLVLAVGVLGLVTRSGAAERAALPPTFRRFLRGQGATVVAAIAMYLGAGLAALVTYGTQAVLNRFAAGGPADGSEPALAVPRVLQRVTYAWGLTVPLLGVTGVALLAWVLCRSGRQRDAVRRQYGRVAPLGPGRVPDEAWQRRIARSMAIARLKNLVPGVLAVFAGIGLVLYAAMVFEELRTPSASTCTSAYPAGVRFLDALSGFPDPDCRGLTWVSWLGTVFLAAVAARLVILGRSTVTAPEKRRQTNVVWDVVAFWPRSVHPFTPWPYSQRVVADLVARCRYHLDRQDGRLVVAAHSQGSLVSLAALLWLTPDERARTGFVTFGSQLRLQFARAFPAFVDYGVMRWLWSALGCRWRSLYRDTDPIGGPALSWDHEWTDGHEPVSRNIGSPLTDQGDVVDDDGLRRCGPEWRLLDPPPPPQLDPQRGPFAVLGGHSGYYEDPHYPQAVAEVARRDEEQEALAETAAADQTVSR